MFTTQFTLLDEVTADTTSQYIEIGDRSELSIQFIADDITSGNGVFTVEVSNDGVNFVQYNRLIDNITNSNVQNDTRVASCTLSSNTNKMYFFAQGDHFRYIRAKVDVTTDGSYSAIIHGLAD